MALHHLVQPSQEIHTLLCSPRRTVAVVPLCKRPESATLRGALEEGPAIIQRKSAPAEGTALGPSLDAAARLALITSGARGIGFAMPRHWRRKV